MKAGKNEFSKWYIGDLGCPQRSRTGSMQQSKTYLKALAQISKPERIHQLGTVCSACGTAFVPNPEIPSTETCGLCKVRLKAFYEHMESLGATHPQER